MKLSEHVYDGIMYGGYFEGRKPGGASLLHDWYEAGPSHVSTLFLINTKISSKRAFTEKTIKEKFAHPEEW